MGYTPLPYCRGCGKPKNDRDFYRVKGKFTARCRECHQAIIRKKKYGIDKQTYDSLLKVQGFACAICGQAERNLNNARSAVRRLAVDHDHSCCGREKICGSCIRGLLCDQCNRWLGILENTEWVSRAQAYLSLGDLLLKQAIATLAQDPILNSAVGSAGLDGRNETKGP